MLGPASSAQMMAIDLSTADRVALRARAVVPWRSVVAAVLVVLLGVVLMEGFPSGRALVRVPLRSDAVSRGGLASLPLAAQGPISTVLGANDGAYRISASGDGFRAVSPGQRLRMRFGRSGVVLSSGSTQMGLRLRAVGYGASLTEFGDVAPRMRTNRVVYARGDLTEWYTNGPLGLEQGFVIPRALPGYRTGPLTLSMALSGDVHASLATGGQRLTLSHAGGPSLRYGGLVANDARGYTLPSWLVLHGKRLMLRVDARGARYPLRIDPFIQQGTKLKGSGESGEGLFGHSVALSANGNTAAVGGDYDKEGVGAVWVFTRSGTTWTQQGSKLTGSGESGSGEFGSGVALSSEGNTLLIGGVHNKSNIGAAWVFTRSESKWTQQAKLTGSGGAGEGIEFGEAVALSSNGNTALIGGRGDNKRVGAAWVFTRSGTTWTQQGSKLTGSGEEGTGEFGSVALSPEGNTALIGGPADNKGVGAAWVFTRSGTTWTQQNSKLTGSGEVGKGYFGGSVALSSNGSTALIGGRNDNSLSGATWVFTRSEAKWTQQGSKLTATGEESKGYFGDDVALSSEGNTALISASGKAGAAWIFTRSGSTWTQSSQLTATGEEGEASFGVGVALSSNGGTALIGGPYDHLYVGAAWVFVSLNELAVTLRPKLYFDKSEPWRPLNVEGFLSEKNGSKEAANHVCNGEGTCYPLTEAAELNKTRTSKSFIDVAGDYKTEGKTSYHSVNAECVSGSRLDCDTGSASSFYYHIVGPHEGYNYIDYWIFYRFNFYSSSLSEELAGNHEGDWENVTIAPSKSATTFDFASFSQHGTSYSYVRGVMSCEGENRSPTEEPHESGSCGSQESPKGLRVSVFPAYGDHANYPEECSALCEETGNPIPENGHDGSEAWGNNEMPAALLELPETGTTSWVDWPGVWGNEANASPELPPMSPANQHPHFTEPWISECIHESEKGKCLLTASLGKLILHSTSLLARSGLAPLSGTTDTPEAHSSALGADKYCANWFGGGVQALLCTPNKLSHALETRSLTPLRQTGFVAQRGSRVGAVPGVAQAVGSVLQPGQKLALHGAAPPGTVLFVRARYGKQLVAGRFTKLPIGRGQMGTIRVSHVGRLPEIEMVGPGRRVERPSTVVRHTIK